MNNLPLELFNRNSFQSLDSTEKTKLMEHLAKLYDLSFIGLQSFARWGQSLTTGVFTKGKRRMVFVPGDTITIGWDHFVQGLDKDNLELITEVLEEYEIEDSCEDFIKNMMLPPFSATISPMIVSEQLEEIGYLAISKDDPRLNQRDRKELANFLSSDCEGLEIVNHVRFRKEAGECKIWLYEETSLSTLKQSLQDQGLSLPSANEWAYLAGGGCRTLFAFGDNLDFNMRLHHFSGSEQADQPFDLQEPNFFGLSIAYDPYQKELVNGQSKTTCGGDGGCNICGGLGPVVGYFPCSPHYKPQEHNSDLINGGYEFVRPIIRISKD